MHIHEDVELCLEVLSIYMLCKDDGKVNTVFCVAIHAQSIVFKVFGHIPNFPICGRIQGLLIQIICLSGVMNEV